MSNSLLAAPKATNVTIIGELIPGGSVRGSYFFDGAGAAEGDSSYRWYIDEVPYAPTSRLDFPIGSNLAGRTLRFSVIPKSDSGEAGIEEVSNIYRVATGYQNISDEENNNSFIKQRGNFSIYSNEPSDRIFISSSGAFSVMDGGSQSIMVKGSASYAGAPAPEILQYLRNNPATRIYSTEKDFAALVPVLGSTTRLLLWGANIGSIPPGLELNNVKFVYGNSSAFAFIYDNPPPGKNTIGAFGDPANGGVVPDDIQRALLFDKPKAIYATSLSFTVLTEAGRLYAWGNRDDGGFISATVRTQLDRIQVERVISTAGAFCAIGPERFSDPKIKSVVTWGNTLTGGVLNPSDIEEILDQDGVVQVVASRNAFCAITKRRSKALAWGGADGGLMTEAAKALAARGGIVMCKGAAWAFCMINSFGDAEAWGRSDMGGATPPLGVAAEGPRDAEQLLNESGEKPRIAAMFKALNVDGWYQKSLTAVSQACVCDSAGNDGNSLYRLTTASGVITLSSNDTSFFLCGQNMDGTTNSLIAWGNAGYGGSIPQATRQVLMASQIEKIHCSNGAYGIISAQGSVTGVVTVFGGNNNQNEAGQIPDNLQAYVESGVQELYSIKQMPPRAPTTVRLSSALVARRVDGSYVVWGAKNLVANELILPK
ncbi:MULTISPECIES: hypothetical protein [unclassified Pseudomonas]|jgi:hypothetical protein|uniref:hypothetical protein n=1 Tax=unclassified Pseudomonas TaxID=196821 RepID=UPI0014302991|nr:MULTISPECIES: hypothetical protein [unclassified Pseudomonas]MDY0831218.1 hypothetical protein [Pseudomonas sp. SED1]NIL16484.1 hypothetical protein [Pseudomonas sp. AN3A02]